MVPCLITPPGNIEDQFRRNRPAVRKLYRPLAGLVSFQTFRKLPDSLRPRIQTHMVFKTSELDDIMLFLISRHAPRNPFLRLRQRGAQRIPYFFQVLPYSFRLCPNIFLNGFWRFPAVMALLLSLKNAPALWTCPHISHLYLSHITCSQMLTPY